ncbi:uncharacterized protein LOC135397289 isoform X2 [Ornithodoros turicata]|uniref:uncharacterized protein LOC135397289 isoform X2 n=1 Tax=Ornithodoros turicata TaxID=34597 RepID=UPI0031388F83
MTDSLKQTDDDHDSGTESDDESAEIEELQKYMEHSIQLEDGGTRHHGKGRHGGHHNHPHQVGAQQGGLLAPHKEVRVVADSPATLDSALPSDSDHNCDHHSSEEELEVINNRAGSAEKRKWSQANQRRARGSLRRSRSDGAHCDGDATSSDDEEVRDLTRRSTACSTAAAAAAALSVYAAPVEFRASPPLHVHRPHNGSPPLKVFHAAHLPAFEVCSVSPRKRHRQDFNGGPRSGASSFAVFSLGDGGPVPRPCLDFEKMQQIRVKLL